METTKSTIKCLFIKKSDASFIVGDQAILAQRYRLIEMHQHNCGGLRFFLIHLWTALRLMYHLPGKSFVYVWFADYHSLLPVVLARLLGKSSFVVIGGYDAARRPDLNYGGHLQPLRSWCIKKTCQWASCLLPVTQFTQEDLALNLGRVMPNQQLIYNGVDTKHFPYLGEGGREKMVVTICGAADRITLKRKGVDFFFAVAERFPNIAFRVIGLKGQALGWAKEQELENMEIISWVDHKDLPRILNESAVICQFSRYEAFGVALVEGILAGNIPVGYAYGGTREIIQPLSAGVLIEELDIDKAGRAIKAALQLTGQKVVKEKSIAAVTERFSWQTRKELLLSFISEHISTFVIWLSLML